MPRNNTGWGGRGRMTGRHAGRRSGNSRNTFNNQDSLLSSFKRWFSGSSKGMFGNGDEAASAGRGNGRGMGQGMNRGIRNFNDPYSGFSKNEAYDMNYGSNFNSSGNNETPETRVLSKEQDSQEAEQLKERARRIQEELHNILGKIDELESKEHTSKAKVIVNKDLCTGCGICENACTKKAITVREYAEIDQKLCTLCGRCTNECPANALQII